MTKNEKHFGKIKEDYLVDPETEIQKIYQKHFETGVKKMLEHPTGILTKEFITNIRKEFFTNCLEDEEVRNLIDKEL